MPRRLQPRVPCAQTSKCLQSLGVLAREGEQLTPCPNLTSASISPFHVGDRGSKEGKEAFEKPASCSICSARPHSRGAAPS